MDRGRGRPRKSEHDKAHYTDKMICSLCGGKFIRANQSRHKTTRIHQFAEKMDKDVKRLIMHKPILESGQLSVNDYHRHIAHSNLKHRINPDPD